MELNETPSDLQPGMASVYRRNNGYFYTYYLKVNEMKYGRAEKKIQFELLLSLLFNYLQWAYTSKCIPNNQANFGLQIHRYEEKESRGLLLTLKLKLIIDKNV